MNKKSSNKSFHSEREGQIKFFTDLKISADVGTKHSNQQLKGKVGKILRSCYPAKAV